MTFVDTSHLVALADPSDDLHGVARAWSVEPIGPFVTTEYVLVEFVNALSRPSFRARAHAIVSGLLATARLRVVASSTDLFRAGLQMHREHADKGWSLTDCISFEVMREAGIAQARTHDRHFEQAGFKALLRGMPPN